MRTVTIGGVVVVAVGLAALGRDGLGLTSVWPVLLGVVLAAAAVPSRADGARGVTLAVRASSALLGAILGWLAYAVRVGLLPPDLAATQALVLVVALLVLVAVGAVLGPDALWSGALGLAAYHGVYEPILAADPAGFLTTSPPALLSTLLGLAVGLGAGLLGRAAADLLADGRRSAADHHHTDTAEVRA